MLNLAQTEAEAQKRRFIPGSNPGGGKRVLELWQVIFAADARRQALVVLFPLTCSASPILLQGQAIAILSGKAVRVVTRMIAEAGAAGAAGATGVTADDAATAAVINAVASVRIESELIEAQVFVQAVCKAFVAATGLPKEYAMTLCKRCAKGVQVKRKWCELQLQQDG